MSFVRTPTGVIMHVDNHRALLRLATSKGQRLMLEPATPVDTDALFAMLITEEEREYLRCARPCDHCGHLDVLHQHHCCSFCTVPGCDCKNEQANHDDDAARVIAEMVRVKAFNKVQDQ